MNKSSNIIKSIITEKYLEMFKTQKKAQKLKKKLTLKIKNYL